MCSLTDCVCNDYQVTVKSGGIIIFPRQYSLYSYINSVNKLTNIIMHTRNNVIANEWNSNSRKKAFMTPDSLRRLSLTPLLSCQAIQIGRASCRERV